jgi:uncharacterized phage-associated protein
MESNFYRFKLLNAVLYFADNTKKPNLTKILKLLYFLDFTHFKETGYPSINLIYYAWKNGPVPKDFYNEVKEGKVPDDFADKLAILPSDRWEQTHPERKEYIFKPIEKPNMSIFTPRELRIIDNLCDIYRDATASQMTEITHLPKEPWETTKKTKGLFKYIDYLLSIDDTSPLSVEEAQERFTEHFEMLSNFGLSSTEAK